MAYRCGMASYMINYILSYDLLSPLYPGTVLSAALCQTLFPKLLETKTPEKDGILNLICVPGALLWKGEPYVLVESSPLYSNRMSDSSEDEIGMVEGDTEKQEQDNT